MQFVCSMAINFSHNFEIFQAKRLSELTETDRNLWTNVDKKLGRRQFIDGRGASKVAPRWNETNRRGQIVVPFRFHENYPKKWREFVVESIKSISTYIKKCIVFEDITGNEPVGTNFIEITCAHPETGAFNQGCFSNLGMVGGKQQISLETPECSDNRMKGFQDMAL